MPRCAGSVIAAGLATTLAVAAYAMSLREGIPRTADGRPDLGGNWTNATLTPLERTPGTPPTLTRRQARALEEARAKQVAFLSLASDPNRPAPPQGGVITVQDSLVNAFSGRTGGYNHFWVEPGASIARFDGEYRTSLITRPTNGRIPPLTREGQMRSDSLRQLRSSYGEYDNPESRPLAERCLLSFGSNAGPPMLPNYFYNNNYTIVQTTDHVMIMTEMVHDVRVIPIDSFAPEQSVGRQWMGSSRGWWEGDTLVVETTGIRLEQLDPTAYTYPTLPGGSEDYRVIERFLRVDQNTINYEFTVRDARTYVEPWGGQVPFNRLNGQLYEYACHEANYALENILRGGRAGEYE